MEPDEVVDPSVLQYCVSPCDTGLRACDFDAAIFDLDGVVTRTARVHAATWKRLFDDYLRKRAKQTGEAFHEFSVKHDYPAYVDGKPRIDGLKSFLVSRGITLPRGDPSDPPDQETICGLANRKNLYFRDALKEEGVQIYESTVTLLRRLRNRRISSALVSSSRNARTVLEVARLCDLFDVVVDGDDVDRLGLTGKPAPDLFLKAAELLHVSPDRCIVFEDAISGVEAARAGGFALVVGINRGHQVDAHKRHGADVVVPDVADLHIRLRQEAACRHTRTIPDALSHYAEIERAVGDRKAAVFLDYDGTLTPIVARPDLAVLSQKMKAIVAMLARVCTVAIVSGRDRADVAQLVGLDGLVYAGSHGFDIAGPEGLSIQHQEGTAFSTVIACAAQRLRRAIAPAAGAFVEPKLFAVAVHYRQVADAEVPAVKAAVDEVLREMPELRKAYGKKVIEVRPRLDWDKGRAVRWLLQALNLDSNDVVPFYLGDDTTDEDAFAAISEHGITILVGARVKQTAAHYLLDSPEDVGRFLANLTLTLEAKRHD